MDFSNLNNQSDLFWVTKDKTTAINNIKTIDNYLSQGNMDTFLVPDELLFNPDNLFPLWANQTNQDLQNLVDTKKYSEGISWFKDYLNSLITEVTDYQTKLQLELQQTQLDNILDTIGKTAKTAVNYIVIILVLLIIFFLLRGFYGHK